MNNIDRLEDLFNQLEKECIEANIDEDRIKALRFIKIEAELGLPFADTLKKIYPEVVK